MTLHFQKGTRQKQQKRKRSSKETGKSSPKIIEILLWLQWNMALTVVTRNGGGSKSTFFVNLHKKKSWKVVDNYVWRKSDWIQTIWGQNQFLFIVSFPNGPRHKRENKWWSINIFFAIPRPPNRSQSNGRNLLLKNMLLC